MTYAIYFKEFGVSLLKVRNFCYKIDWVNLQLEGRLKNMCYRGGGDSYKKQTGMLVVSLRGVKFGFWSRLGCSGQSANILSLQGLV